MKSIWTLATAGEVIGMEEAPATNTAIAQDGSNGAPEGNGADGSRPQPNPLMQLMPFILIILVMYMFLFRGPKKKQQEHRRMVESLKKNDRVRTIGGILGTVLDVRDDEIVLKIDEATNTKIRVVPSAVATVLTNGKTE